MRPKLLDLFCCEGGAGMGYHHAGFDVYGVDLFKHQNAQGRTVGFSRHRYPYLAVQSDALVLMNRLLNGAKIAFSRGHEVELVTLTQFDAIHASPPCQHASAGTRAMRASGDDRHPALIEPVRELLQETGLPYVIENVQGAALRDPLTLCGTMFGLAAVDEDGTPLEMWRHRLFESNVPLTAPPSGCVHGWYSPQVAGSYGGARRDKHEARHVRHGGYVPSKTVQQRLLGIDWMTEGGMYQCVPPAYTTWLGYQLRAVAKKRAAA